MFDSADDELLRVAAVDPVVAAGGGYPGPGPSLGLSQEARAARLEKLADLPVFCVSAREAQKLELRSRSDGAPVVFKQWVLAACATHACSFGCGQSARGRVYMSYCPPCTAPYSISASTGSPVKGRT